MTDTTTGATRQAARLLDKRSANWNFYRDVPMPRHNARAAQRHPPIGSPVIGRPNVKTPGGRARPNRHILHIETSGPYERRYHATKGWRVGRS